MEKERVSFEDEADGQFVFDDGQTLKFSSVAIKEKSTQLYEELFGSQTDELVRVYGVEAEDFKVFLDLFLGVKKPVLSDVFRISSIARRYNLWSFESELRIFRFNELNKLSRSLKELDEDVIISFNSSLRYFGFPISVGVLISFLMKNARIYKIFNEKKYYLLLEPEAVAMLCKNIIIDSQVLNAILNWAKNYLEKKNDSTDPKTFIKEHSILENLKINHFESYEALQNFINSDLGKNFFSSSQWLRHAQYDKNDSMLSDKCIWVIMKAGDILCENFVINGAITSKETGLRVKIKRNPIVFFDIPEDKKTLVDFDVQKVHYYDENYHFSIDKSHSRLSGGIIADFEVPTAGKCCEEPLQLNCTWTFNADCRIAKTFCHDSKFGKNMGSDKVGYFFIGDVQAIETHNSY